MAELHVSGQIADANGFAGSNLFCEVSGVPDINGRAAAQTL